MTETALGKRDNGPADGRAPDFPEGVAVVLGGSGGIGSAISTALAKAGSDAVVTYLGNAAAATDVVRSIKAHGRFGSCQALDLTDREAVKDFFAAVRRDFGPIHTIVNAVGAHIPVCYVSQIRPEDWEAVMENDLLGFYNAVHASLPHVREARGSYVNLSTAGLRRWPVKDVLSVAPKAAIQALIHGIAREEGPKGVRANTIALGLIDAGLFHRLRNEGFDDTYVEAAVRNTALRRLGQAEEVADVAVFLASARASYVTGQVIAMDGGFSL